LPLLKKGTFSFFYFIEQIDKAERLKKLNVPFFASAAAR